MNCPMCGKEMTAGNVQSDREINWIGEDREQKRISSKLFAVSRAYAERCNDCGITVIRDDDLRRRSE